MHVTIDRIIFDLQQADDGQSPINADAVRSVLIAEVRRALADSAGRIGRGAGVSAYRLDAAALDVRLDDPADLTQMARGLAQRIVWLVEQAGEGKVGQP